MNKYKFLLGIISVWALVSGSNAQSSSNNSSNFGLKMGVGLYQFYGEELKNPMPMLGYVAGIYYHDPLKKGRFHYQAGLDVRFRGGNFNNAKSTDTAVNQAYTSISLVTVDLPLKVLISTDPNKGRKAMFITAGVTPSYIMRSVLYVGPNKVPLNQEVFIQQWDNLPLKPIEILGSIGVQKMSENYGYAIDLNVGINSLNDNFKVEGVSPVTGSGLRISTLALEASLIF